MTKERHLKPLKYFILMYTLFTSFTSCNISNSAPAIPNCIEEKITAFKNKPVQNPPAEVWKWKIDLTSYYYITSDCCDQFNYLYDANCTLICAADGGFTDASEGKCSVLIEPIQKTLIWEDLRK
jgi:hypothetical protein